VTPNGWITVYPGETVYVEVQTRGNKIVNVRAVSKPERPAATITFKFDQVDGDPGSMLVVTNPLRSKLKYDLGFMPVSSDQIVGTSSCPVRAGLKSFESWPHPIFQLVIANLRLMPDAAVARCE
jgi:hypothetical protein